MRKNKSAIKKTRQAEERRLRNSHVKSTMKGSIKRVTRVVEGKAEGQLDDTYRKAVSLIDKAASKGVIHRNNAARKVSRLAKKVHASFQSKG